nr:hypothetical protein Hi04_10k_c554_00027 [uncultured bacterium]
MKLVRNDAGVRPLPDRGPPEGTVNTVRLEEIFSTLRRHLWLVLGIAGVAVAGTGYFALKAGPVYRAVAVIRLSDPRRALTGGVVEDPALIADQVDQRFVDPLMSQVEMLTSHSVAGAVVDSMPMLRVLTQKFPPNLLKEVSVAPAAKGFPFQLEFGQDSVTVLGPSGRRRVAYGSPVELDSIRFTVLQRANVRQGLLLVLPREAAITRLIATLRVHPRLRTDIVDVSYSAPDPDDAQQVVNRIVDIFRATSAEAAQRQSRLRREFLEGQLRVNDSLLAGARQALTEFQRRSRSYGAVPRGSERTELLGLELQRQQLLSERRTDEGLLKGLQDTSATRKALQTALATPGVATTPAVGQLNTQMFQYEMERDSVASRSPSHPDLPRLNQLISSTEKKLLRAVQAGVQASIASLDGRIAAIDDLRAHRAGNLEQDAEEARLTERVENVRRVTDELRIEYQKAGIAEAVTVGQVEVVDHAVVPVMPAGTGLAQQLGLGLLLGLVLGVGGAFAAERLRKSIVRRAQVEHLGMTVLGVVPHCSRDGHRKGSESEDAVIDAFRGVRVTLANAYGDDRPMVVTVTSPASGDGKSFISTNLALAFVHDNQRTLLVDADVRRGALHRSLMLPREPGLTDFLAGNASLGQVLQPTTHPSLTFLGSGSRRRDAPELMGSPRMADLMTSLRSRYSVIVVDTAPLGAGIDALLLAKHSGSLVMVLRLGKTDLGLAEAKVDTLRQLPIRVLGAVLNDVRDGSEYYAYSYYQDGYEVAKEPLFRPVVGR